MTKKSFKLSLIPLAVAGTLMLPNTVIAEEEEGQKLTIVGSHIKRTDNEGPSPVASMDAEEIAASGVTDLIGLFTKLPISGQGTFSTQGNSSDDTANGGSSVSLRGLGADSTLILINGRRVTVSPFAKAIDTAFVDINNIPISAIARVDILKDGASATYGSDAIAGVINIVLKDDFDGVQLSGKVGTTADGGGDEKNVSLLVGNVSEKSSHTFIMDYYNREETLYADRSYSRSANQTALRPNDPDAVDFRSSAGIPGTIALRSNPGERVPDTFGNDVCPAADIVGTLCRYDYAPYMTMVPSTERFSFNYIGKFEISDNVTAFTELNGQNAKSVVRGAASPSFNELFMDGDNPNHPFANDPSHPFFQQDLTMRRRTVDIGNREKRVESDYYRAIAGLEGSVGDWDWETALSFIKNKSVERGVDGFPNSRRTQEAIDSGLWNPFEPSSNTQEALDFIETQTTRVGKSTVKSFDAKMSGPVAEMEHGDLMMAVGVEARSEAISDAPDDQFKRGEVFGTEATQATGSRKNKSVFTEFAIPLTETFEAQVAVRFEDYNDFGSTTNPKLAFRWAPSENMIVRGSYGTAFRAPSLHQLGLGRTDESPSLIDTPRCQAAGDCDPKETTVVFSGNPNLKPEESSSYNFGLIYQFTDNFSFSVDYYNYEIENIILSDSQFLLNTQGTNAAIVERLPSTVPGVPGEIVRMYDQFRNIGDLNTSGLDFDIQYDLETDMGQFKFSYILNYVLNYEDLRTAATTNPNNTGPINTFSTKRVFKKEGDFEQPEIRWTFATEWSADDMSVNSAINYIGEFNGDAGNGFGDKTVDAMVTVDAAFNYTGIENTTLTIGATNLFNEEPPFSHHDFMGFVNSTHSGQGRFLYLKASYNF